MSNCGSNFINDTYKKKWISQYWLIPKINLKITNKKHGSYNLKLPQEDSYTLNLKLQLNSLFELVKIQKINNSN